MAPAYIAAAAVVKVSIGSASGNSVANFVRRGEFIPAGVDELQLERLRELGFIEEFELLEPEPEPTVYSEDDAASAVQAAVQAKDAELADVRKALQEQTQQAAAPAGPPPGGSGVTVTQQQKAPVKPGQPGK